MQPERKTFESAVEYQVGWVTALPLERAAAIALLDERHNPPHTFLQNNNDTNSYTFGRIGEHNIVVAGLPAGIYGVISATRTALGLVASFPHIRIGLLVGIGAAIPESKVDIRLGDVVVGQPKGSSGGVIQYDFRKATKTGSWEVIGTLAAPPVALLNALGNLQAEHSLEDSQMTSILEDAYKKNSKFADGFGHPGIKQNVLFPENSEESAEDTMDMKPDRLDRRPYIHYGTIASGATLVKNAKTRGEIFSSISQPCLCLEMEAAGLQNDFPCLVIRGICDYADEQKNDTWQSYAAATAASFAKELLMYLPRREVDKVQSISAIMKPLEEGIQSLKENITSTKQHGELKSVQAFLRALYTCPYAERKNRNMKRLEGTCNWFTNHPLFIKWRDTNDTKILWTSADPGCGKSVLARHLVDDVLPGANKIVCYFFFKDEFLDQKSSADAACALLRQLLVHAPTLVTRDIFKNSQETSSKNILEAHKLDGDNYFKSFSKLWTAFVEVCNQLKDYEIICVLDALDECQKSDRKEVIQALQDVTEAIECLGLKILVTSRRYYDIDQEFSATEITKSVLHLDGDTEHEKEIISKEIDVVLKHRINILMVKKHLAVEDRDFLITELTSKPQRTYLWAHLTLNVIEETPGFTRGKVKEVCAKVPSSVDEAYDRILCYSTDKIKARTLLSVVVAAERPITVAEMSLLLILEQGKKSFEQLADDIELETTFRTTVRQLCGLFIVIVDSCIYLLHQTAREFLIATDVPVDASDLQITKNAAGGEIEHLQLHWKQSLPLPQAHRQIAQKCIWLMFLKRLPEAHASLWNYASRYWNLHFRKADFTSVEGIVELALKLCSPARDLGMLQDGNSPNSNDDSKSGHYPESKSKSSDKNDIENNSKTDSDSDDNSEAVEFDNWGTKMIQERLIALHSIGGDSSVLMVAAYLGLCAVVEYLLAQKKLFSSPVAARSMALKCAIVGGNEEVTILLLSHGAKPDALIHGRDVFKRAGQHFAPAKQRLLDWNQSEFVRQYRHFSCLHHAVSINNERLVKILLDAGAHIESIDDQHRTPLLLAVQKGYHNITEYLLQCGARTDVRDQFLLTPLEYFIQHREHNEGKCQIINQLWHHGKILDAGPCVAEFNGDRVAYLNSMLNQAILWSCLYCSSFLLQKGANINYKSIRHGDKTWTPFVIAVNDVGVPTSMLQFLIDKGASLDLKDENGASAIHFVRSQRALEILLHHGANINAMDNDGKTLLMKVMQLRYWAIDLESDLLLVRAMLKHKAGIQLKDNKGMRALDYALQNAYDEKSKSLVTTLKDHLAGIDGSDLAAIPERELVS